MYNSGGAESNSSSKIDLNEFAYAGVPRITKATCAMMAECASVCLRANDHCTETKMDIQGDRVLLLTVVPLEVDEIMQNTHNDLPEAAHYGAYGIAFLLVQKLTQYTVVERSRKSTGFDYYLGNKDDPLFQKKARMEVSGQYVNDEKDFRSRIKKKREQSKVSDDMYLPAYTVVVGFAKPKAHMEERRIDDNEPTDTN